MIYKVFNKIKFLFSRKNKTAEINLESDNIKYKTRKIRQTNKYQNFRKKVKSTLPHECWNCSSEKNIQIHHIVSLYENEQLATDINNVIMLCKPCHVQFHKDCTEALNNINKPVPIKIKVEESIGTKLTKLYTRRKLLKTQIKEIEIKLSELEFEKAKGLEAEGKYTSALKAYSKAKSFGKTPEYLHALKNIQKTVNELTKETKTI